MKKWLYQCALVGGLLVSTTNSLAAYNSGSTGADGEFNPSSSQAIQLPADGIFNYTSVNIPAGVTITYIKNANNTPVTILASGDVTVAGTIDVSASSIDVTGGGIAGPGGFNGGASGTAVIRASWVYGYDGPNVGRAGQGPGGGSPGVLMSSYYNYQLSNGAGGAYGTAPVANHSYCTVTPATVYGNELLIPMVGGSGGGGGAGGVSINGTGGGGGGGALLIAASGNISVTGALLANGGVPASAYTLYGNNVDRGTSGGGGSGGAIRLIAPQITGNGTISAQGGVAVGDSGAVSLSGYYTCGASFNYTTTYGGAGRIRLDADAVTRTTPSTPAWSRGAPTLAFVPGLPKLTITSIGGVAVPSGNSSIALPAGYTNPVTVNFTTQSVTVGSSIKLTVTPAKGQAYSATSAPTTGTNANAAGSVAVTLNPGSNSLLASVTYTVVASVGDAMSIYAKGERVEKVNVATALGGSESVVTLITVTGKEYVVPEWVLRATAQS